ncbi:MAG TPA: serine/threonine-protein kinase [Haliangiales bacterium]|nr:serine/threonine-protein kinase [Haliangiales bacterium]
MAEEHDPRVGREVGGRYRIVERLATGGMGVVYRAERLGLGRPVAIKFLHPWIALRAETRRRFEIEARAASRLSHPSCAAVTDFGIDDGAPFLVMDLVTGETLRSLVERGPLSPARALHIARQILAGLSHAHGHGIVHRDIKPQNVILTEATGLGDQVRILDFGLAKLIDETGAATTGFAVGTPGYMAPEQAVGDKVDARTDVYAVGVLLFELLAGRKPYVGGDAMETFRMHREAPIPAVPGASPALDAAVARALAKRPDDRHADAAAFAAALAATPEARPAPPGALRLDRARRSSARIVLLLVALGAAAAVAVAAWPRGARTTPSRAAEPADTRAADPVEVQPPADELARIRALVAAGRTEAAITQLVAWRGQRPRDAAAAFLLGHLYFEKLWWNDGMQAYDAALAADPSLRADPTFIKDLVHGLVSDNFHGRAEALLLGIGPAALPYLDEAARTSDMTNIRRRAAALAARLR